MSSTASPTARTSSTRKCWDNFHAQQERKQGPLLRPRTHIARRLRRDATEVEKRLWYALRGLGSEYRFRRQHPIGRYVVDFACPQHKLAIELDGGQHAEQQEADAVRTRGLGQHGYRVIRFWNGDVIHNLDGVLETIRQKLSRER